ncbi:MAG: methylated-DNA--[protein]-cysteine S-methyltransferase [Spirochaetales bacterium]|nr:methylated-DNA--[protein]-cysteine S-methyltransferase [Spirochaetales bacterium]
MTQVELDYERVKKSIEYISENYRAQPDLNEIAEHVHVSPYHFQRLFIRWAGVSPKKFLQYVTLEKSKRKLEASGNLLDVAYEVGLSGSGRLHDLYVNIEGMTPGQYRENGTGITIFYGFFSGPFGRFLLAVTSNNKICSLQFADNELKVEEELKSQWHNSTLIRNKERIRSIAEGVFDLNAMDNLQILARGTPFQIKVWEALLKIPFGQLCHYQGIAEAIQQPSAIQAVGSAVGRNPVAYLIPCHRVIRKSGNISQYHWGETRKRAMIAWESSHDE